MTKQTGAISYVTRGTKASLASGRSSEILKEGGSTDDESGEGQEHSESEQPDEDEAEGEGESNAESAAEQEASENSEGVKDEEDNEVNGGEGEEEPEESSDLGEVKPELVDTKLMSAPDVVITNKLVPALSAFEQEALKMPAQIMDIGMGLLTMDEARNKLNNQASQKQPEKKESEDEMKDEEEQFNWEHMKFQHLEIENSGNTFKQKPEVFC